MEESDEFLIELIFGVDPAILQVVVKSMSEIDYGSIMIQCLQRNAQFMCHELCNILLLGGDCERANSATLLYTYFIAFDGNNFRYWEQLSLDEKNLTKSNLLDVLRFETNEALFRTLTQMVFELVLTTRVVGESQSVWSTVWTELILFVIRCLGSVSLRLQKFALTAIQSIPEVCRDYFVFCRNTRRYFTLFYNRLFHYLTSPPLQMKNSAVKAAIGFIICLQNSQSNKFDTLVCHILRALSDVALHGEVQEVEDVSNQLRLFVDLKPAFLTTNQGRIISVMSYMVQIAKGSNSDIIRKRAIKVFMIVAQSTRPHQLIFQNVKQMFIILLGLIKDVVVDTDWEDIEADSHVGPLVKEEGDDEETDDKENDDEHDDEPDDVTLPTYVFANAYLDRLIPIVGARRLFPFLNHDIISYIDDVTCWEKRHVGLLGLSKLCKGFKKDMEAHLSIMISQSLRLLNDVNPRVQWAAATCLKHLGEALHDDFPRETLMEYQGRAHIALGPLRGARLPFGVKDRIREAYNAFDDIFVDAEGEPF